MKARAAAEANKPPITGWRFNNLETEEFEDDESLTCCVASPSPPCRLTVSLSGSAKKFRGKCEGEYRSTGLTSFGRQVLLFVRRFFSQNYRPFWQVFKLEGSDDCYLYVRDGPDVYNWSIWSSLKGGQIYINSASAGQACPAHPTNASNVWDGYNDWRVKKKRGNASGGNDWEEGGVVVRCSVHNN